MNPNMKYIECITIALKISVNFQLNDDIDVLIDKCDDQLLLLLPRWSRP